MANENRLEVHFWQTKIDWRSTFGCLSKEDRGVHFGIQKWTPRTTFYVHKCCCPGNGNSYYTPSTRRQPQRYLARDTLIRHPPENFLVALPCISTENPRPYANEEQNQLRGFPNTKPSQGNSLPVFSGLETLPTQPQWLPTQCTPTGDNFDLVNKPILRSSGLVSLVASYTPV